MQDNLLQKEQELEERLERVKELELEVKKREKN